MGSRFYRKIAALFGKYTFNVHFFVLNIHFFGFNIHFSFVQKSTYVQIPIMKFGFLIQQQIFKKHFKIFCGFVNPFLQVCIVCTDKGVSEIPRIFCKNIISCRETKCP